MKKVRRNLKLLLLSSCLAGSAFADYDNKPKEGPEVWFNAYFHFQTGIRNQNGLVGDEKNVSANRKQFAFYTDASVRGQVSQTTDEGLTYGAQIVLVPTTKIKSSPSYNGSHLFVESEFGKVEAGSPFDVGSKMRITGGDITAASGDWDRYVDFSKNSKIKHQDSTPEFITYVQYFFDDIYKFSANIRDDKNFQPHNTGTEPPRLISYYTPKMNGFQLGVSYIPDTSNTGGASQTTATSGVVDNLNTKSDSYTSVFEIDRTVKDAFAAGLSYEQNITDGVDIKLALTGEYGKSAKKATEKRTMTGTNTTQTFQYKLSNLRTYNIGGILTYGNFSYAVSYGSLGKSLTFKEYYKGGRDTRYYNGAIAYGQGPIKASLAYFKSQQFKNTVDAITLGTDYKLTPGLVPYAEVTGFNAKGRPVYYDKAPKKKTKGAVVVGGLKLNL